MILGIDTSCYTTSLAVVDKNEKLLADYRRLLPVQKGNRGLAQSKAFFVHVNQLPLILDELYQKIDPHLLRAVCVSDKPRALPGSYMPVFKAGENLGKALAATLKIPLYTVSHQDGHLKAAMWSCARDFKEPFLAVHLSGGTTELLLGKPREKGIDLQIVGDCDLAAGQFVDRIGVALGLPFPAGPHLEVLAQSAKERGIKLPLAVKGSHISFSGPESAARRLLNKGAEPNELAWAVFQNIGESLLKAVSAALKENDLSRVIFMGGVMANNLLRTHLKENLKNKAETAFADKRYSGDNAVGVALCGHSLRN